jgi:hypothetical protein
MLSALLLLLSAEAVVFVASSVTALPPQWIEIRRWCGSSVASDLEDLDTSIVAAVEANTVRQLFLATLRAIHEVRWLERMMRTLVLSTTVRYLALGYSPHVASP